MTRNDLPPSATANREAKDSVFCDLFSDRRYLLELYRDLHPEDVEVKEDDVKLVTLERVVARGQYNDVGFTARNRILVLLEAQSTWSTNIIVRMLFYLVETYRRQLSDDRRSLYGNKRLNLPLPELYVVYTGAEENAPEELLFSRDIVDGQGSAIEVRVKVIRADAQGILGEYVEFTHEFDEKRALFGNSLTAVRETINACMGRGILKDYLASRREEVIEMMTSMLDREEAMRVYLEETIEEAVEEAVGKAVEEAVEEAVGKAVEETRKTSMAQGMEKGAQQALAQAIENMMKNLSMAPEEAMDALEVPEANRTLLLESIHRS